MASKLSAKLRDMRAFIVAHGVPSWAVYVDNRRVCSCSSWSGADYTARVYASRHVGREFRAEERKTFDGIQCLSRQRRWCYHYVPSFPFFALP